MKKANQAQLRPLQKERDTFALALAYSQHRGLDGLTPLLESVVNDLSDDIIREGGGNE